MVDKNHQPRPSADSPLRRFLKSNYAPWVAFLFLMACGHLYFFFNPRQPLPKFEHQPNPKRKELVRTLEYESLKDTISKLANFDDVVPASAMIGGAVILPRSYQYQHTLTERLSRVRKIVAQAKIADIDIGDLLIETFIDSCDGYEAAQAAREEAYQRAEGGLVLMEPDDKDRKESTGPAAAYLLAELGVVEALPVMMEAHDRPEAIPVNRVFLFSVMRRLVETGDWQELSPPARRELERFQEVCGDLPAYKTEKVPSWNAKFEETDFRSTILGQDLGIEDEPSVSITLYPYEMEDFDDPWGMRGNFIEYPDGVNPDDMRELPWEVRIREERDLNPYLDALRKFIQAAFPEP